MKSGVARGIDRLVILFRTDFQIELGNFSKDDRAEGWLPLAAGIRGKCQDAKHGCRSHDERKMFYEHEGVMRAFRLTGNTFLPLRLLAGGSSSGINRTHQA
jgi:hypothetical protein